MTVLVSSEDAEGYPVETWANVIADETAASLPAASITYLGKTYQYTGVTGATYTHDSLYICVSDGETIPAYSWEETESKLRCKWVNAHGSDALENMRVELGQTATITLRYTSLITQRCKIFYENDTQTDANAWTVVSPNDPEDRHKFMEITLQRKVAS